MGLVEVILLIIVYAIFYLGFPAFMFILVRKDKVRKVIALILSLIWVLLITFGLFFVRSLFNTICC